MTLTSVLSGAKFEAEIYQISVIIYLNKWFTFGEPYQCRFRLTQEAVDLFLYKKSLYDEILKSLCLFFILSFIKF